MFSDYQALKDAIIAWADNEDVTPRVDDYIALMHARLNRLLRLEEMCETALITCTVAEPLVAKPAGYLGMRRAKLQGIPGSGLTYRPLSEFDADVSLAQQGRPTSYVPVGTSFQLGPVPNAEFVVEVLYYQRQPTLTATVTTNVFLEQASDLCLYGSLLEAEPYLKDHEMWQAWQTQFSRGLTDISVSEEGERFPDGDAVMRALW